MFLTTFVLGWIIQLVGHAIEGKRPALADNILQVFNAPLFLTVEVLASMGLPQGPVRARARGRAGGLGGCGSRSKSGRADDPTSSRRRRIQPARRIRAATGRRPA